MKTLRYLFFITALALTILGAGSFMRVNQTPDMNILYIIYAFLMFGDGLAMLACGLYINRKIKAIYWFALIVLSLNIVLTIFDQFGLIDLLFVLLNIITLVMLFVHRKEILPQ
jgi:lysylphosphatidylglycerol synthetase-like protein (DUF2156 family)